MLWAALAAVGLLVSVLVLAGVLVSTGALTLDTGWGRRVQPLGPLERAVAASPEAVFDVAAVPYASARPPQAVRAKVTVLDRGDGLVVAAHRTRAGLVTTVTVEAVTLERPHRIRFRLLRGPVPHVVEELTFAPSGEGTQLRYAGELGTDFWWPGALWGRVVAAYWVRTVAASMEGIVVAAEAGARRRAGRKNEG